MATKTETKPEIQEADRHMAGDPLPAVPIERVQRIIEDRKVTFGYTRKKNLGNYESEDCSIFIAEFVPTDVDMGEWLDAFAPAYDTLAKAAVWRALGMSFTTQPDGSIKLDEPPTVTHTREWQEQAGTRRSANTSPPAGRQTGRPRPARQPDSHPDVAQAGYYADRPQFCKQCGERDFYDNRHDNDEKIVEGRKVSPDYKCKNCGEGVWRPGSYEYNQTVGSGAPRTSPPRRSNDTPFYFTELR